jgi:hypothetical protein
MSKFISTDRLNRAVVRPFIALGFLHAIFSSACVLAPPSRSYNNNETGGVIAGGANAAQGGNAGSVSNMISGGVFSSGGVSQSGNAGTTASAGGATLSGGSARTGGLSVSGGSTVTGGTSSSGGSGSGGYASGGAKSSGGIASSGGSFTSGGASAKGGMSASGGTSTGGMSSGGATVSTGNAPAQPPPVTNGTSGFTTRFWDCCKPSCGWSDKAKGKPTKTCSKDGVSTLGNDTQSVCVGGTGYMCYWGAPWSVSDTLSYGFAAYNNVDCGTCFQLQFTGKGQYNSADPGSNAISGKTLIVQIINIGDIGANQFDLLIPGGGVGANTTGCPSQWGNIDIGQTSGGVLASCGTGGASCVQQKCQAAFGNNPQMLAGCNWFSGWFKAADDPQIVFQKIACPAAISAKSGM